MNIYKLLLLLAVLLISCQQKKDKLCSLDYNHISNSFGDKVLVVSKTDSTLEIRDLSKDTILGGYYTFKNGKLMSYEFFTRREETYSPSDDDIVLNKDSTKPSFDFCSYAEYHSIDNIFNEYIGIPLVYSEVVRFNTDSLKIKLFLFNLNKKYEQLSVQTNSGFSSKLSVQEGSVFTNMSTSEFIFNFQCLSQIMIYVTGKFFNTCSEDYNTFSDTISLKYENCKITNGS